MRRTLAVIVLSTSLLTLAPATNAQFSTVAGSGCPRTAALIKWGGSPQLGQTVAVKTACSSLGGAPFLAVGLPGALPINPPLGCGTAACVFVCSPLLLTVPAQGLSAGISLPIPSIPALVGFPLRFQGVCADLVAACVDLTIGVQMVVLP